MRPPVDTITAPAFPRGLEWLNGEPIGPHDQYAQPLLVEFWDFCRPHSLRTLPYVGAWHRRYAAAGLRVVGVHSPGFEPSADPAAVRAAVERLGVEHRVVVDADHVVWRLYDNMGWPARYLFGRGGVLVDYHLGEGGYAETERAIQELVGVDGEPVAPLRPEDEPGAELVAQTVDQPGPWSGPYEAGAVWAVLSGRGEVRADGRAVAVEHPGAYLLVEHPVHTSGRLELEVGDGVECHAVCFTPGLAR